MLRARANKFEDCEQIKNIDSHIKTLNEEIERLEVVGEGATYENLWKITNSIIDYTTEFLFENNIIQNMPGFHCCIFKKENNK